MTCRMTYEQVVYLIRRRSSNQVWTADTVLVHKRVRVRNECLHFFSPSIIYSISLDYRYRRQIAEWTQSLIFKAFRLSADCLSVLSSSWFFYVSGNSGAMGASINDARAGSYKMKSAAARNLTITTERELELPEVFSNVNGYTRSGRDSGLSTVLDYGPYRSTFNGKRFRWQDRPQSSLELLQEIDELCKVPEQRPGFTVYSRSPSRKKRRGFRFPLPSMSNVVTVYIPLIGVCSYEALSLHLVHKGLFTPR